MPDPTLPQLASAETIALTVAEAIALGYGQHLRNVRIDPQTHSVNIAVASHLAAAELARWLGLHVQPDAPCGVAASDATYTSHGGCRAVDGWFWNIDGREYGGENPSERAWLLARVRARQATAESAAP
jgi:hypothetical protein